MKKKKRKSKLSTMQLNADEPFLEQLERAALESGDDEDLEWLEREIYQRPDRLSELTSIRLPQTDPDNQKKS